MKKRFLHTIFKFSFACAASVAFYLGLPAEQREDMREFLKKEFMEFFDIEPKTAKTVPHDRFMPDLSDVDPETVYYFNEILRFSENSPHQEAPVHKWTKDVNLYLYGHYSHFHKTQVIEVVKELNRLIYPRKINLVKDPKWANSFMYFGSIADYNKNPLSPAHLNGKYLGHFHILTYRQEIQKAYIFVNTKDAGLKRQKHVIREEITQSLGFINDSYEYPDSIFYQLYSENDQFSEMDKRIIRLLYQGK